MRQRFLDPITHECSVCGRLVSREAWIYHDEIECFWGELAKIKLEKELNVLRNICDRKEE